MNQQRRNILGAGLGLSLVASTGLSQASEQSDRSNRLVIAYNEEYAPYSWREEGKTKGILPDILDAMLAPLAGLQIENVTLPWQRVQANVRNGRSDALCTFASEERRQYAFFHKTPVVTLRPHLFFAADSPVRKAIEQVVRREDLARFRLIDMSGNQWAEQNLKDFPRMFYVTGHESVFRMIMAGRGDVHVSLSPVVIRWNIKKLGLSEQQIMSIPAPFISSDVPFHLLVSKTHPRAEEILQHLDEMLQRPGTTRLIEEIIKRYV